MTGFSVSPNAVWKRSFRMVLAAQLFQRGVSVSVIENAFVLAATRRLMRPADAQPLATIRSLAYFLPFIEESQELPGQPGLLPVSPPESFTASSPMELPAPALRLSCIGAILVALPRGWKRSGQPMQHLSSLAGAAWVIRTLQAICRARTKKELVPSVGVISKQKD